MKKILILSFLIFAFFSMLVPTQVSIAQEPGLWQLSQCSGVDCSACNVVHLANGVIKWLIGILFVLFAVLVVIAGIRLVMSGGNHHALDEAKSMFLNVVIGFIIILAAWLIIDTVMRALVGGGGNSANDGSLSISTGGRVTGWMFWSDVQCQGLRTPGEDKNKLVLDFEKEIESASFWPGDPTGTYSNSEVISVNACAATPAGNVNCDALTRSCRAAGNSPMIDKTNPQDYRVNCVKVEKGPVANVTGSGSVGCSGVACVRLTIPCSASGCNIARDMVTRLARMHSSAGVSGARATEAMPPSRAHKSACHQNGTCIDYSKAGGMTGSEVARVVSAAQNNGLRAVYEVQTQSQKDSLVAAGAPAGSIKVLGNWISAPHFSIYGS